MKREALFLYVKWWEKGTAAYTWEPVINLYHLPLVRQYLEDNKLASYIPTSYKNDAERNVRPRNHRHGKKKRQRVATTAD